MSTLSSSLNLPTPNNETNSGNSTISSVANASMSVLHQLRFQLPHQKGIRSFPSPDLEKRIENPPNTATETTWVREDPTNVHLRKQSSVCPWYRSEPLRDRRESKGMDPSNSVGRGEIRLLLHFAAYHKPTVLALDIVSRIKYCISSSFPAALLPDLTYILLQCIR